MFLYWQLRAQDLFVVPCVDLQLCQLLLESSLYVKLAVNVSGHKKDAGILKC